ncbi:LLM class flavin-dependent oxidoreductase [Acinetobacter sp. A47]|uniref:LLM class flavin-dependent oxidoreductase n=1 Tax=Acinetobacter sp. A47 TaxID=1561217 RepID=UPI00056DBC7A|nr:LLM class flavin-dependent oxidoreductase [Acinetobacter sp. A47]
MNNLNENTHFILGIFASNCSGGMSPSKLEDSWKGTWQENLELVQMAEQAGIDFMLSVARFIGFGGERDFQGSVLEPIAWTAALLARTERIKIFTTLHTAKNNPIIAAKQLATMIQIGGDRVGLNIVAGCNKPEYEAVGLTYPHEHNTRYKYAQEWCDLLKKTWTNPEPFDWNGIYFKAKGIYSKPHLTKLPPLFNAGTSREGREFAIKNSDYLFTAVATKLDSSRAEIEQLKDEGRKFNKNVRVLTYVHIICRPTEEEAMAEWERQLANADKEAVNQLMNTIFPFAKSMDQQALQDFRTRVAMAFGGFPLVGTPEQVADGLKTLHDIGFSGGALTFLDYKKEFAYFGDNVLPLLRERDVIK